MTWNKFSFPEFDTNCSSLLCRYLTEQVFEKLKNKVTGNGFTFSQAINSGVVNQDSSIGVYAGDAESYRLFDSLFDPIIADYHGFSKADTHRSDLSQETLSAANPDPAGQFILSTRIRVGRNVAEMPLGPALSRKQRNLIESQVAKSLCNLTGELAGTYYPLLGMDETVRDQLVADHFLFKAGDRFLDAAGLNCDWPEGRGIFHNREKTFLVWVNEEDQLRIISMQQGGDIEAVFTRLVTAVKEIEKSVSFMFDQRLGYVTSCPTNLGTAMRASVHIRLPKLSVDMPVFKNIADSHHLQIRGIHGEHSESESGIFDVSNRRRLGVTEVECVQDMYAGIVALINKEKEL
ncbi:MAG: phosphagen kinase [Desulfuromusa sp.]|nr:phosphagen kinase [Desulfuromusa sp.]